MAAKKARKEASKKPKPVKVKNARSAYTYFQNENWANLFIIELCKRRNICVHPMRTGQCPLGVGTSLMTLRSPQKGHRIWSPDVSREKLTI